MRAALAESFLSRLPADAVASLVAGAERIDIPASTRICAQDGRPSIRLVERGLLRIARASPDGRAITQRYLHRGDIGGIPAFFHGAAAAECQAIVDSVYYQFRFEAWREVAQRDARVAYALLEEVSRILHITMVHLVDESLASMRGRVARELLDIAADNQNSRELVAAVTQQQLADGIGSVREVVARALRELRELGAVATGPRGIVIVDPHALRAELDSI
jgi:CRP/FNR family transcriptional regulator